MFKSPELYIDLGTANTLIYLRGKGFVLNEPSFLTIKSRHGGGDEVFAVGHEAKRMLGRTPSQFKVLRPLREGVIADFDITTKLLREFLHKLKSKISWLRPRMVISLPCKVTPNEREAVEEVARALGARKISLIEEPMAAAIGAGLPILKAQGSMVVDIGGGSTEIAVTSCGGIVYANAVRVGGDHMDERIAAHLRQRHNFSIGEQSAEQLKIELMNALPQEQERFSEVGGLDMVTGTPTRRKFSSKTINDAIREPLEQIIHAIRVALENTPAEVAGDIAQNGLVLAGGGALISGLAARIRSETGVIVKLAESPLLSIAMGGAKALEDQELLERIALPSSSLVAS